MALKAATPKKTPPRRKPQAGKGSPMVLKTKTNDETSPEAKTANLDLTPDQHSSDVTPGTEVLSGTDSGEKRTAGGTKSSASCRGISEHPSKLEESQNIESEQSLDNEEALERNPEFFIKHESDSENLSKPEMEELTKMESEEPEVGNVSVSKKENDAKEAEREISASENIQTSGRPEEDIEDRENKTSEDAVVADTASNEERNDPNHGVETNVDYGKSIGIVDCKEVFQTESPKVDENRINEFHRENAEIKQDANGCDDVYEDYGDHIDFEEDHEEEIPEEDLEELSEETHKLEDECKELTAAAKERRLKKDHEIFIGGLGRDATEKDVRSVFEIVGEVVGVRIHKDLSTDKNKGFAFVQFARKESAKRALSEIKNPVIAGKRCGTAPSEDNDTLFLGNICNTWTKDAIRKKLRDYGVKGVEDINLVPDFQHEDLSRGFAFLEFSCHSDAMLAYKRLQKPDVIFGHPERTAKVAFAEPLREPDPEVMAKVKTVFLDGLPPHWNEECVRERLKNYGEIVRVTLARNISTAKRKDYGFVDFSSHEAAESCIKGVNRTELTHGNSKTKVKARLSNPLPKTQAVKGGMCGGFRIHHGGSRTYSRSGSQFGRVRVPFNRPDFHDNRDADRYGWGQISRMRANEHRFDRRYPTYYDRQTMRQDGRRGHHRGGYHVQAREFAVGGPSRSNRNRPWYDPPQRVPREHPFSARESFPLEEPFDGPFGRRQYDDPYMYDEAMHGRRRPSYMTDPDFVEPRRVRPRLAYSDPVFSFRGSHYDDAYGARGEHYPRDYYSSDFGAYPTSYGAGKPYRGGRSSYY